LHGVARGRWFESSHPDFKSSEFSELFFYVYKRTLFLQVLMALIKKKKGRHRNAALSKIQYPMKNHYEPTGKWQGMQGEGQVFFQLNKIPTKLWGRSVFD